jgi:hypothetical protein
MAISTTPCPSEETRKATFPEPWRFLQTAFQRLVVFFTFSEEERVRAGIHIGRKGPER